MKCDSDDVHVTGWSVSAVVVATDTGLNRPKQKVEDAFSE
jgi:hypothetical protein